MTPAGTTVSFVPLSKATTLSCPTPSVLYPPTRTQATPRGRIHPAHRREGRCSGPIRVPCSNPSRAHPVDMSQPQKPLPDVGIRVPTCRSLSDVGETGFTSRKPILIGVVLFFFRISQSDGGDPPALGLIWEIRLPSSAFPNGKDLGSPWADSRGKIGGSSSV